jgi:hypothetical protein
MASTQDWLDRLMTVRSRREALKMALAGAAALTLPLARSRLQPADNASACEQGCRYYWGLTAYQAALSSCDNYGATVAAANFSMRFLLTAQVTALGAFFTYVPNEVTAVLQGHSAQSACYDQAVFNAKAHAWDCLQPGCPGFNPKAPDGPCAPCHANCCTCSQVAEGYICCIYSCDDPDHSCCPGG